MFNHTIENENILNYSLKVIIEAADFMKYEIYGFISNDKTRIQTFE